MQGAILTNLSNIDKALILVNSLGVKVTLCFNQGGKSPVPLQALDTVQSDGELNFGFL